MMHRQARLLIWILALLPTAAAAVMLRSSDLAGPGAVLNYLGRLTGVAGLGLMLAAAILSCRVPGFDRPFGGLTKLWRTHHQLAAVGFLLILAHPVLLALGAANVSLAAAAATLAPAPGNYATLAGWLSLLLLMIFLAPSFKFFGEPDYQRWKALHRLAAPAIILALVHTLYLARTLPDILEWVVWLGLAGLAVASIGYRLLWSRRFGRRPYRVQSVDHPANNVVELHLAPEGEPLRYEAGQFVYLTPLDPELPAGRGEEHPYTVSSAPGEPGLRIAIKALGDASRALQEVTEGSRALVEGPYGNFFPPSARLDAPELWISGGIGVTPFLGRARHLAASGSEVDVILIHCVQDEARALFADELRGIAQRLPGFQLHLHYFYRTGPLDASFLLDRCPDVEARTVYICGPQQLLSLAHGLALGVGVGAGNVVTEEFDLL